MSTATSDIRASALTAIHLPHSTFTQAATGPGLREKEGAVALFLNLDIHDREPAKAVRR